MTRATLLALAAAAVLTPTFSHAQRYQVVAAPEGSRVGPNAAVQPKLFIIDTQEGHLWTWAENDAFPGRDERRLGNALIYQGRVRPGKQPGELIDFAPR